MTDLSAQPGATSNQVGKSWLGKTGQCRFAAFLTWLILGAMLITREDSISQCSLQPIWKHGING
jgi:hypothetical protein